MPKSHKPFFLVKLLEQYRYKKEKNKNYSLRRYAQFLDIHSGTLSAVLRGKRTLPNRKIETIIKKLALSECDQKRFLQSLTLSQKLKSSYLEITPERHAHFYEELEYFIVLALFKRGNFKAKPSLISQETGICTLKLDRYLTDLINAGLLNLSEDGDVYRTATKIHVVQDGNAIPLRKNQRNNLKMTAELFEKLTLEEYDYSHMTLYLDKEGFEKLRKDVRSYRDQLNDRDQADQEGRLYRIAIQIFPILNTAKTDS